MASFDPSARLTEVLARYDALTEQMSQPDLVSDLGRLQELAREQSGLEGLAAMARDWLGLEKGIADARGLIAESGGDREMEALAREEQIGRASCRERV